jgi:hypothetical protein
VTIAVKSFGKNEETHTMLALGTELGILINRARAVRADIIHHSHPNGSLFMDALTISPSADRKIIVTCVRVHGTEIMTWFSLPVQ